MSKRTLTVDEVAQAGLVTNHEQMDNGECRYRLMGSDGSGYIRTVAGAKGAWQNSHYHTGIREFITVQQGWIAFVRAGENEGLHVMLLQAGEFVVSEPHVGHNIYMPVGAVTHCVKFGNTLAEKSSGQSDWHADPELDRRCKHLGEPDLMLMVTLMATRAR